MIILRQRHFSYSSRRMIDKIIESLDKSNIEDYEVVDRIPRDVPSVTVDDRGMVRIILPEDLEYSQYDIEDFLRDMQPNLRVSTTFEKKLYILKVNYPLDIKQVSMLVKYIISENEFCSLIK